MQVIIKVEVDVATYVSEQYQKRIRAPEVCPNCGSAGSLEAHGYYWRWVTEAILGELLHTGVRRFFAGPELLMDKNSLLQIQAAHQLYCQLTAQKLTLRFDRERLWYEFLRAGFNADDLKIVVRYLQKEIRANRRNVGALKLSNLLQLDRFEEDLNISKVRLLPLPPSGSSRSAPPDVPSPNPAQLQDLRQQAKTAFSRLRQELRNTR